MENGHLRQFLEQLARGIAAQFGPQCEVTVHDLTGDLDGTICAIENGHVTGRKAGDGASEIVLETLKEPGRVKDLLGYQTRTSDGRVLKSSSIFIRDRQGRLAALLCINYDITAIYQATGMLSEFIATAEGQAADPTDTEMIFSNVDDLLDRLIEKSCDYIGKPVAVMTKEEKVRAIQYLDAKGAFLIKKAGDRVSKFYDISKYTLYNYLDAEIAEN
ncbi:MAG: helix-turn-helix transcriptional regulator [Oscillospiraceae bacterium]|nr:helix-turn-helix transcriptional regulator [Oscillospiraceae bacterium]